MGDGLTIHVPTFLLWFGAGALVVIVGAIVVGAAFIIIAMKDLA